MQALIFADRLGRELEPLTDRTCVALLPVVGKPVLEHTLETLAAADLREVIVVVSPFADDLRATLGDGSRWGMRLDYVLTRGEEDPNAMVERFQSLLADELLILRGDVLHGVTLSEFLRKASLMSAPVVYGRMLDAPVSLCLHRKRGQGGLEPLRWTAEVVEQSFFRPVVELPWAVLNRLESLRAYHQANLDAAAGRFPNLIVPGRQTALGLTIGLHSKMSLRSLHQGIAFVGQRCRIEPSAEFYGEVVIAHDVIIDRHTILRNSVVLSDTYIGELLNVQNAIIRGNQLIRVDTGAVLSVVETFLLADLREVTLSDTLAGPINRLLGVLLLLVSLPLWPLALAAALFENFNSFPLRKTRLRGNRLQFDAFGTRRRRVFTAWQWATSIPLLRYLPGLLAVVSGDLRLVGVEPLTPEQAESRSEEWEWVSDQAPAGLLGPTQLLLPADAPREERLLSDAFYARQRNLVRDLRCLLRGLAMLLTYRAWWPVATHRTT